MAIHQKFGVSISKIRLFQICVRECNKSVKMPKVKSGSHYGERHSVYETTSTSEENSQSTNDKLQILSPREINERYHHAAIICAGVENIQISKDEHWDKIIQNLQEEAKERKVKVEWCNKLKHCIIVNK